MKKLFSKKYLWENSPVFLKKLLGIILKPISKETILGRKYKSNLDFIRQTESWNKDEYEKYQLSQLQKIINLAYEKSLFYRNLYKINNFRPEDLINLDDIKKIPFIEKADVIDNLSDILTVDPAYKSMDYVTTGGTSGVPLVFYINSDRSYKEYPYLVSGWERVGYKLGMPMAVLRGRVVKPNKTGVRYEYDPILNHHYFSTFHLTDKSMGEYLDIIQELGDCYLHVYPSSVYMLAKYIKRNKLQSPCNIKAILAESEIVYPDQRSLVEEVFKCRYYSSYGHTEKLVAATECEFSENYHVWPCYGYFELVDKDGNTVTTPGEEGEIVGTGFINTVMPFIRYKTGDYATLVGNSCDKCGRNHMIINNIIGHRIQEYLVARDGNMIPWTALNMHDDTFDNVRQFQFLQDKPGEAILKLVPESASIEINREHILRSLYKKLENTIDITIQIVEKIPLTKSGKTVYVDQHISN